MQRQNCSYFSKFNIIIQLILIAQFILLIIFLLQSYQRYPYFNYIAREFEFFGYKINDMRNETFHPVHVASKRHCLISAINCSVRFARHVQ